MNNTLRIRVPGKPYGQARHRARGFIAGKKVIVTMYDPKENVLNKRRVHAAVDGAIETRGEEWDATGPMRVTIDIRYPCLRPLKTSKREADWRAKKPDIDNIVKWLFDGMEPIVFLNDSQVVDLSVRKVEGHQEDPAAVTIMVERIVDEIPSRRIL